MEENNGNRYQKPFYWIRDESFSKTYCVSESAYSDINKNVTCYINSYDLSKENKEGYLALRELYNKGKSDPLFFLIIMISTFYKGVFSEIVKWGGLIIILAAYIGNLF